MLLGLGLWAVLFGPVAPAAEQSNTFLDGVLRQERFSAADLAALHNGDAVVKTLETPVRQELALFGAVYINTSTDLFVERFRDIERFESGPGIPQLGRFSTPPRLEDLSSLTLPDADVGALPECAPADCGVKLSEVAMTRFRQQVNWSAPDAALQVNGIARDMILGLVQAYQANGNAALGQYHDGSEPLTVAEQFNGLISNSHRLPVSVPGLMEYLAEYPRGRPVGAEDLFYWSVVAFGLKPTLRVNHVVIYPHSGWPSAVSHVIAIKQLYASHYFHTALELRFLVDDERDEDRSGFYLLSITRSRIDGTSGLRGALLRPVISRRSRNAVRGYLDHLKRQVESPAPAP